ncbi:MAG: metallophosphoesterase [Lentisphaeria bacterium]|nr:metallophosphoesterase [Lentisphaeria bacterium]
MKCIGLILAASLAAVLAAEEPLLKIGVMSDTHVNAKPESFRLVKPALELFREKKVDLVVHMGDFASRHCPGGYRLYRELFDGIFKENKPAELFVYDGHDARDFKGDMMQAFAAMKKELRASNDPYDKAVIKGHIFLIYPFRADNVRQEKEIAQAVAEAKGRPVFVLDHHPPFDTTPDSRIWGNRAKRRLSEKFPQIIRFSGHSHGTLWNERNIWQGQFTTVNAGCLQSWPGMLVGNESRGKRPEEVMVVEVFQNKIIFRCFTVTDKKEIRPDKPWTIPWPFDQKTAPYSLARRKIADPLAEFPAGAKLAVVFNGKPARGMRFSFPEAENVRDCYRYKVLLSSEDGPVARRDLYSSFYLKTPKKTASEVMSAGYFEPGKKYTLTVTPMNFAGREGKPLTADFTAPEITRGKIMFESADPLLPGCQAFREKTGEKTLRRTGEFFHHPGGNARLEFPKGTWEGEPGALFRLVMDLRSIQAEDSHWTIRLCEKTRPAFANLRICTPSGDSGVLRYVIEFRKPRDADYFLLITEGAWGRFQIRYLRVERL